VAAFRGLKSRFTSALILTQPEPELQFVVDADAFDTGVGAVLSQRSPSDVKLHPCAFLSIKLSPAEINVVIGNRELLAVKLALEAWRHWSEGSVLPFIVWTDHPTSRRLNSWQTRWAMFFGVFNFTLTYRLGSKNNKSDALSLQFTADNTGSDTETIMPSTCIVAHGLLGDRVLYWPGSAEQA
jgi:hypothetical protein